MDLRLNELSLIPLFESKYIAHAKMIKFAKTAKAARDKNIRNIKSDYFTSEIKLTDNYTLFNWLFDKDFIDENRIFRDFLQSMITKPYIDEEREEEYLSKSYFFEDKAENIEKQSCIGLAAAYLYDDLSISFQNGKAWRKNELIITINEDENTSINKNVFNVYSPNCFINEKILNYVEQRNDVYLIETTLLPSEKSAHFSDHHGKDKLEHFWKKINLSPYVISSRSCNWGGNKFIRNFDKNGIIEIVLTDTEHRYALQIETTGRNYYETKRIAEILEEQFS